jgi:hypothetical protein
MNQLSPEMLDEAVGLVTRWGLRVIGAIVVLILGRLAAGMVSSAMRRGLSRAGVDPSLAPFLSGIAYYAVLAVVLIAVLNLFGIETTSLIAVLGAAGLAVGLALQGGGLLDSLPAARPAHRVRGLVQRRIAGTLRRRATRASIYRG